MISLIAAAYSDGWAFVRQGYTISLIRPPYDQRDFAKVDEGTVERAVRAHGYAPELLSFPDWEPLVELLKKRVVEAAIARVEKEKEAQSAARLLKGASEEVILAYLNRVEGELVPGQKLEPALCLLAAVSGLPQVAERPALRERASRLLEDVVLRITSSRADAWPAAEDAIAMDPGALARSFPRASERYGSALLPFVRAVRARGYLMAIGE
jgi:hypothetical protein